MTYNFNLNNVRYTIDIKNCILKIFNNNTQIGNDIKIANEYAKEEDIVKALVEMEINSLKDAEENKLLIDEALKKLGLS